MITGILLAAGSGSRFGSQKLIYRMEDIPIVCKTLQNCLKSELKKIIVVTGADRDAVEREIKSRFPAERKIKLIFNRDYEDGMFSSFRKGLSLVGKEIEGVMMILGDMPFVSPETINRLLEKREKGFFVIPRVSGRLSHPRIIPSLYLKDFENVPGNGKGLEILKRHWKRIIKVDFDNREEFMDVDSVNSFGKSYQKE